VGERPKAGQKLNREEESQKGSLKVGRAKDRRAKGTFCPGPEVLHGASEGSWQKKEKKKGEKRKGSSSRAHFSSVRL